MISSLIWLFLLLVVVYVVNFIIDSLNLPENIKNIAHVIVALIVLLVVLNHLVFVAGTNPPLLR